MIKTILFLCIIALIASGCYTDKFITKESDIRSDAKVHFVLKDGKLITSSYHEKTNSGYKVYGTYVDDDMEENIFDGYIQESNISYIYMEEVNTTGIVVSAVMFSLFIIDYWIINGVSIFGAN